MGGTNPTSLQHWLLRFGEASGELHEIVTDFAEWLAKEQPPQDVYHALMSSHMIYLGKEPTVRTMGVVGTWPRMMENCVLKVTGQEATEACRKDQICGGMDEVIEGGIHIIRLL